ncbi:MAG: creatininase family protein [Azospirillaceae bacterium]
MSEPPFHRFWRDWTTAELSLADTARLVALLPVGAIEQHGPHLPLDTDTAIVEAVVEAAIATLPAWDRTVVLPTQAVGRSAEHEAFPGTLSVAPALLADHWTAILRSVARTGIRRFCLLNAHGGQPEVMDLVARRLRVEDALLVAHASWFDLAPVDDLFPAGEVAHGIHGGAVETSLMLAIAPGRVRRERLADFPSNAARWAAENRFLAPDGKASFGWMAQDLNPAGVVGDAGRAEAETGRIILDRAAKGLATLLGEVASFQPPWLAGEDRLPE